MTAPLNRATWLRQRGSFVGASEVGSILGLPGAYSTLADVWVSKVRAQEQSETDEEAAIADPETSDKLDRQSIGLIVEPAILSMYEMHNPTFRLMRNGLEIKRHPKYPFIGATRDAYAANEFGDLRTVEAKNVNVFKRQEWGDEGSDQVPAIFAAQGVQQMLVCADEGFGTFCDFAVFFGGNDFKVFTIAYDAALAEQIIEVLCIFWNSVEKRIPPDVDYGRPGAAKLMRQIYSKIVGSTITLDPGTRVHRHALEMLYARDYAHTEAELWAARKEEAHAELLGIAGDNARVEIPIVINGKPQTMAINRKPKKGYVVKEYEVAPSVAMSFEPYRLKKRAEIFEALEFHEDPEWQQLGEGAAQIEGETE